MSKKLLIHNHNIANIEQYEEQIRFISIEDTLNELNAKEFDAIYIKDNLSVNCLDFYGLVLAYHIRLTQDLNIKKFTSIIILSDLDGFILSKLTPFAQILLTKNIFILISEKLTNIICRDTQ